MISPVSTTFSPRQTESNPNTSAISSSTNKLANETTFLQLLVTQLKNQDPENPQDGTQFVAQLAQFSSLEQQIGMHQDLDNLSKDFQAAAGSGSTSSSGTGSGSSTGSGAI